MDDPDGCILRLRWWLLVTARVLGMPLHKLLSMDIWKVVAWNAAAFSGVCHLFDRMHPDVVEQLRDLVNSGQLPIRRGKIDG